MAVTIIYLEIFKWLFSYWKYLFNVYVFKIFKPRSESVSKSKEYKILLIFSSQKYLIPLMNILFMVIGRLDTAEDQINNIKF